MLVFSLSGYVTVEQKIGDRSIINVTMKPELIVVEDQVFVGLCRKERLCFQSCSNGCRDCL